MSPRRKRLRSWLIFLVFLGLIGGASAGIYRFRQAQAILTLPVAPVHKGDFLVIIRSRGELKAARSKTVYAPIVPQLRIAWLAPSGTMIHEGDSMIRFDSSAAQQQLQQKDATLRQLQATLDQTVAQSRITLDQDNSDLADAQFTVERAKLEVSKQEIVGQIQAEESRIALGIAEQRLKTQQATVALHRASETSHIGSLTRQRDNAQSDVDITKTRISQMEIRSPLTGFLVFSTNYTQGNMDAKPFKVGDNVFAGMSLAEIPDLTTLQLEGKIEETDRGRIAVGQQAIVRIDSLPELSIPAKVGSISPLAEQSNEWPRTRSFKAWSPLARADSRLQPGMNGGMDIIINRIPNATSIPAKALFTHAGKAVVYVEEKGNYTATEVQVLARNPDEIAISGVPAGSMVAMVDVATQKDKKK
ncbi:MAG TPA: efflux RND transporter periplasmic adaptor subunit [Candidatus Sulfopaludibacter sp.]|jgi:HlyD family secretion protein|nr:efflux RND transporter periplasmic adaptor subunit [Candidatus Sulfopaludibacter sp.]